eukprot:229539_1
MEDSVFGFWQGLSGQAYEYNAWITDGATDHFGSEWVLSAQQRDLYRGNGIDLTVNPTGTFQVTQTLDINKGFKPEKSSDWACTEIIIINQKIPLDDIICIENYLLEKYSTNAPTTAPTSAPSNAPSFPTTDPTNAPSNAPTEPSIPPTLAPTAKLQWCVETDIIDGWYDGDSIDIANDIWTDKSGHNNHGSIGVSTGIGVFNGTTETHELFTYFNKTAVYGATTTQITFNVDLHPINHTVFNYCKYREVGQKYRIIQTGPENGCFGFWRGSGQAFENNWITDGNTDWFGNEWVISAQQHDLYRGNRIDKTDNPTATFAQTNQLMIGLGAYPAEISDWACTEIIVINQKLPLDEIICIENYLLEKYSTNAPTTAPTSAPSNAPSFPTTDPTNAPSNAPTEPSIPPTLAPTAKLQWCVETDIIDGWYDGDSIDIANDIWTDKSGHNNHGSIGVSTGIGVFNGTTETHELFTYFNKTAVYGATTTQITFNVDLHPINHTVFNYCKYREVGQKYRIIQTGPENGCFGFWRGSGQAFENNWITDGNTDWFGNEWVISAQQHDLYRGNRIDKTDNPTATFAQTNQLMIGLGAYPAEISDWACTEIIVINQKLPLDEIICIENYLLEKYSTNAPTSSPTDAPSNAPTTPPTSAPSNAPTSDTTNPSGSPTDNPSASPSDNPSASPSDNPSSLTIAPTTYPTVSPTSDTTSPSQAPTAKLEWCVDPSIIDGWYDGDSIDIANNVWTDKSVNNNDGNIGVSTGIGVSDGTTETHEL